jgi:hypothetical protein
MTRTLTVREYLLETLNRRMRERGEDVELVFDRPRPRLAEVVPLASARETGHAVAKEN